MYVVTAKQLEVWIQAVKAMAADPNRELIVVTEEAGWATDHIPVSAIGKAELWDCGCGCGKKIWYHHLTDSWRVAGDPFSQTEDGHFRKPVEPPKVETWHDRPALF